MPGAGSTDDRRARRSYLLRAGAIIAFALALRLLYVGMAQVEYPIRGDINQYVLYAWNLEHRHVFSMALPDQPALPDSYRGPGYPAFLALSMLLAGHADLPLRAGPNGQAALGYRSDTWMTLALLAQVLLGTATVWLTMQVARYWLAETAALGAGAVVAVWPHLISFTGVLLSETLFAFALLLALAVTCGAARMPATRRFASAGLLWGACALVNPVVALFPFCVAALFACRWRGGAAVFLAGFVLVFGAWSARNAIVAGDSGALQRAEQNFVEGSWPQYHKAFNSRNDNEISRRIVAAIDSESQELWADPAAGLARIGARFAQDPSFYLAWYAARKPFLLWDWDVRVGAGDIYYLPVTHSPFVRIPLLHWLETGFRWFNPIAFALAAMAAFAALVAALRRRAVPAPLLLIAALLVYLTAVHVALQAEPRYSIPYRPEQVLLVIAAIAWLYERAAVRRSGRRASASAQVGAERASAD